MMFIFVFIVIVAVITLILLMIFLFNEVGLISTLRKGKQNIDIVAKEEETSKDLKEIREIDLKVHQLVKDCTRVKLLHNSCLKRNYNGECVFKDRKRCIKYKYELADIAKEFCKHKIRLLEFQKKEENKSLSFYIARIIYNIDAELVTLRPLGEIPEEFRKYIPEKVSDKGCRKPRNKINPIVALLFAPIAIPFMLLSLLISIWPYILIAIGVVCIIVILAAAVGGGFPFLPFLAF